MQQKSITIVTTGYNNVKYYERNLASIFSQNYNNFNLVYTDDASPDGTADLVEKYIEKHNQQDKVTLIKNKTNVKALKNLYDMIHQIPASNIIATVDADDWLPHPNVLKKINEIYQDENIWCTYGQYKDTKGGMGCSRQIPPNIINSNTYRRYRWCTSHLRTMYAGLFHAIPKEQFLDKNGNFYGTGWDLPIMFSACELAGPGRHKFVSDVLYIYNYENPINDAKVDLKAQQSVEFEVRAKKPYQALKEKSW